MRVAVVGGRLQGLEAVYLAKKAGWQVTLIDKEPFVPAAGLADHFSLLDVTRAEELIPVIQKVDLIIPALEDKEALTSLQLCARKVRAPLVFDEKAYAVSSSKLVSNGLFARLGIPAPLPWPQCNFPVIAKPSGASGSAGVTKIRNRRDFQALLGKLGPQAQWVIEEYLEGPSFSVEVLGFQGQYQVLQITELHMDGDYDCKRVLAPVPLLPTLRREFEEIALTLAESLQLNGIMDVETILHEGRLKVLEIDARLPSQTPSAVYKSTGINMLQLLGEAFVTGKTWPDFDLKESRGVVFEHIRANSEVLEVAGEHIIAEAGPLQLYRDFFGADEAITNFINAKNQWVATLLITGATRQEAWEKRCQVIRRIRKELNIRYYLDPYPTGSAEWSNQRGVFCL